jgi:hypothetical protein
VAVLKRHEVGIRDRLAERQRDSHEHVVKRFARLAGSEPPDDDPVAAALDRGEVVIVPATALPDEAEAAGLQTGAQWSLRGVRIDSATWIRVDRDGTLSVIEQFPVGAEPVIDPGGVTGAAIEPDA